jgi:hypothetical protein
VIDVNAVEERVDVREHHIDRVDQLWVRAPDVMGLRRRDRNAGGNG